VHIGTNIYLSGFYTSSALQLQYITQMYGSQILGHIIILLYLVSICAAILCQDETFVSVR